MSTHNLCFEQKYEKYQNCLYEHFQFLVVKFSLYLNRHVFVMFTIKSTFFFVFFLQCCAVDGTQSQNPHARC